LTGSVKISQAKGPAEYAACYYSQLTESKSLIINEQTYYEANYTEEYST